VAGFVWAQVENGHMRARQSDREEVLMLWGLIVALVVLWLLGFLVVHIGGGLIHLLLVIAVIVLIYQFVTGRRSL
jgi:fatty acid desaturase